MQFPKEAVGKTIRKLRDEKELSQEVASGLAGIGRSHLSMIENGTKQPNFETIWKLAGAFGLKASEFVARIEKEIESEDQ